MHVYSIVVFKEKKTKHSSSLSQSKQISDSNECTGECVTILRKIKFFTIIFNRFSIEIKKRVIYHIFFNTTTNIIDQMYTLLKNSLTSSLS